MKKQSIYIAILGVLSLQACKKDRETKPGTIVYKTVNATMEYNHPVLVDIDNNGDTDFHFFAVKGEDEEAERTYLTVYSEIGSGNKIVVRNEAVEDDWGFWAKSFDKDTEISATTPNEYKWNSNLTTAFLLITEMVNDEPDRFGPWLDKQNGYLAVQFRKGDNTHFGWIRLSHINGTDKIKIEDYAYNPVAGQAIRAGQK